MSSSLRALAIRHLPPVNPWRLPTSIIHPLHRRPQLPSSESESNLRQSRPTNTLQKCITCQSQSITRRIPSLASKPKYVLIQWPNPLHAPDTPCLRWRSRPLRLLAINPRHLPATTLLTDPTQLRTTFLRGAYCACLAATDPLPPLPLTSHHESTSRHPARLS